MINRYDLIKQATELFKFKKIEGSKFHLYYIGLLSPSLTTSRDKDSYLFGKTFYTISPYGHPALAIEIKVTGTPCKQIACNAYITSSDDSGCSIFGKPTTLEKALKTAEKVKEFFEYYDMICPDQYEIEEGMRSIGMYPEFW